MLVGELNLRSSEPPLARARRRGLAIDEVERLARAIAGGMGLDFDLDLEADSQHELRAAADAQISALGGSMIRRRRLG